MVLDNLKHKLGKKVYLIPYVLPMLKFLPYPFCHLLCLFHSECNGLSSVSSFISAFGQFGRMHVWPCIYIDLLYDVIWQHAPMVPSQ